jgi:hypothetical protein
MEVKTSHSLVKLNKLIAKLDAGKAVSLRDINTNLGANALIEYNKLWAAELERRKFFEVKPELIKQYDELVKQADFANNKYQPEAKHPKPSKHYQLCINLQKKIIEEDARLAQWFDRSINQASAEVDGVARLVTSRSSLNRASSICETKETIKRRLLVEAAEKIDADEKAFSDSEQGKKLKLMLADLKAKSRL